jgi:hypothetical protein
MDWLALEAGFLCTNSLISPKNYFLGKSKYFISLFIDLKIHKMFNMEINVL